MYTVSTSPKYSRQARPWRIIRLPLASLLKPHTPSITCKSSVNAVPVIIMLEIHTTRDNNAIWGHLNHLIFKIWLIFGILTPLKNVPSQKSRGAFCIGCPHYEKWGGAPPFRRHCSKWDYYRLGLLAFVKPPQTIGLFSCHTLHTENDQMSGKLYRI